jgi:hypothetical protein
LKFKIDENLPAECAQIFREAGSTVSVLAVKHAENFNGEFFFGQEEDAVITYSETELVTRRLELFHIARAGTEITVDSMKYAKRRLPIDRAEVCAGFR